MTLGRVSFIVLALLAGLLAGCVHAPDPAATAAVVAARCPGETAASKADWGRFRRAYPYHIQGIAMSEPSADGSRTLIVAEPPPHVALDDVKRAAPELLSGACVEEHRVGHDGWTRDVVVTLPKLDATQVADLASTLQELLFRTTYKAYVLAIPSGQPVLSEHDPLNLQITAAELNDWIADPAEGFSRIDGGPGAPLAELVKAGQPGVYFSDRPGLVAWVIPRMRPFEESAVEARQFALDTDIVVGAVASPAELVVLGRERSVGVDVLPPLRVETLMLLAAVKKDELKQSYERMSFLAGRFDGRREWAPISLSPELVDTEYGSLLDITDQILKSWSNNGRTRYESFGYPDPPRWAFPGPIPRVMAAETLIYNWNTRGQGTAFDFGGYEMLAFRGTGALPVTYIAGKQTTAAYEETAYQFFAGANDPYLVRVAQYASIYQIFRRFQLSTRTPAPTTSNEAQVSVLQDEALRLLTILRDAPVDRLSSVAHRVVAQMTGVPPERRAASERGVTRVLAEMGRRLHAIEASGGEAALRQLASDLSNPRGVGKDPATILAEQLAPRLIDQKRVLPDLLRELVSLDAVKDRYVGAATLRRGTWVHTPTVVVSWNEEAMQDSVGGHNLDARVTRIRFSDEVAPGRLQRVKESGADVVLVNPRNFKQVSDLARNGGKSASSSPAPVRTREVALELHGAPRAPSARGFSLEQPVAVEARVPGGGVPVAVERRVLGGGWRATRQPPSAAGVDLTRSFSGDGAPAVLVKRVGGSYEVTVYGRPSTYEVSSVHDVTDLLANVAKNRPGAGEPMVIHVEGALPDEAHAMVRTIPLRAKAEARAVDIAVEQRSVEPVADAFKKPCDLTQARVGEPRVETLADGRQRVVMELTVPSSRTSLRVRLRAALGRQSAAIKSLFARLAQGLGGRPANTTFEQLLRELNQELQSVEPDHTIEVWADELKRDGIVLEDVTDGARGTAHQPG